MPLTSAHRQPAVYGLGARCQAPSSMTIAERHRGHVPPTAGLRGADVGGLPSLAPGSAHYRATAIAEDRDRWWRA
jgi:hypothetical protein